MSGEISNIEIPIINFIEQNTLSGLKRNTIRMFLMK